MTTIQPRRDTAANWAAAEAGGPQLAANELAVVTDTHDLVIGDGTNTVADLPRIGSSTYGPMLSTGYDIVIVAGQSNATARSSQSVVVAEADSRLKMWDVNTSTVVDLSPSDVQWIGNEFAREYAHLYPGRRVLVVPTAVGSTGFTTTSLSSPPSGYTYTADPTKGTWDRTLTADPVNHALTMFARAQAALSASPAGSRFVAVLWSQGESDRGALTEGAYVTKLDDLIAATRTTLGVADLPWIIGDFVPEMVDTDGVRGTSEIMTALIGTPARNARCAFVPGPRGYPDPPNNIHWNPVGQAIRGRDMARAVQRARLSVTGTIPTPPGNMRAERFGGQIRVTWDAPDALVTGYTIKVSTDGGTTWATWPMQTAIGTECVMWADPTLPAIVEATAANATGTSQPTRAYVGPGGAALHTIPVTAGLTHRWVALAAGQTRAGRQVTKWRDLIGGLTLDSLSTSEPSRRAPVLRRDGAGHAWLEFNGTTDVLANGAAGTIGTVVMVARYRGTDTTATILASGSGVSINRISTTGTLLNGTSSATNAVKMDNAWRYIAATASATAAQMTIDATKTTGTASGIWGTTLRLGANGTPAAFSNLDVAEVLTYSSDLTDPDIASIRTALQAAYAGMLA